MYSVAQDETGRWYIAHPFTAGLAWSDEARCWVLRTVRLGYASFETIYFASEEEADDYATEQELYPRR